jgi:hypothetical protein
MIALLPLLVALVGLVLYAISANPKVVEVGRVLLFCGVLVTLFVLGKGTVKLL